MSEDRPTPEQPLTDTANDLASRGTPLSLAMGFETLSDRACGMRVGFRSELVGDPAQGGLAGGVVFALLDQTSGMAIGIALRDRAGDEGRGMVMGGIATLDFRLDHIRPPRAGAAVIAEAECVGLNGDVAVVRGFAYDDDPADPIAVAQAAFMIMSAPTATV